MFGFPDGTRRPAGVSLYLGGLETTWRTGGAAGGTTHPQLREAPSYMIRVMIRVDLPNDGCCG